MISKVGLTDIQTAIDTQFVPGIDGIKRGLFNPAANANCAAGSAGGDPSDDCGIKQAVAFFKASIPVLVNGITADISTTLLGGISAPAGGCQPDTKTLICSANALVAGRGDVKAGAEKLVRGPGELGAGGESSAAAR